jgi:hypothetical protein
VDETGSTWSWLDQDWLWLFVSHMSLAQSYARRGCKFAHRLVTIYGISDSV